MQRFRFIAFLVILVVLIIPSIAFASGGETGFQVLYSAGSMLGSRHWRNEIDNSSYIPPSAPANDFIVQGWGAYIDPAGQFPWTEFGAETLPGANQTSYFYTRDYGKFTCLSPMMPAFDGYGCEGPPNAFNVGQDMPYFIEADSYGSPYNEWEFWAYDQTLTAHGVALLSLTNGTVSAPRVQSEEIWTEATDPLYTMYSLFLHPEGWITNWVDIPSASLSHQGGACPTPYSASQPSPDDKVFFLGDDFHAPGICTANPFY